MASGDPTPSSLVHKLTPFVKSGQVFSKTMQNGGDFHLVKSALKFHTSPTPIRKAAVSEDVVDADEKDETEENGERSLVSFVRRRTDSIDSQGSVEEELSFLRKKVEQQEQTLESLKLTILSVREESTCQKEATDRVRTSFRGHRSLIDRTLRETQRALQEHQAQLSQQALSIQRVEQAQSSNVFLESAYILLGMYIIQTPLVRYTVQLISVNLDRRGKHAKWLPRFMQIVFFMHFVKLCRAMNSYLGFSSGLHSAFSWVGKSVSSLVRQFTGFRQNVLTYDSPAYQNWVKSTEQNTQGFNVLSQHRLIQTGAEASTTNSLNIC